METWRPSVLRWHSWEMAGEGVKPGLRLQRPAELLREVTALSPEGENPRRWARSPAWEPHQPARLWQTRVRRAISRVMAPSGGQRAKTRPAWRLAPEPDRTLRQGVIGSVIHSSISQAFLHCLLSARHWDRHRGHGGTKTDTTAALGGQKFFTYLCRCIHTACIRNAR